MKINISAKRNGITKIQIDTIVRELARLKKIYPDIIVGELRELTDDDDNGNIRYEKYMDLISIEVSGKAKEILMDDVRREFCIAMIDVYRLDKSEDLLELFYNLGEEDINDAIISAFVDSFWDDSDTISREIRNIIDIEVAGYERDNSN